MKLKLNLEQLTVDSFDTTTVQKSKGTVFGEQCTCWTQCGQNTCPGCPTCDATCGNTCVNTCDDPSCAGSCDASCYGTCAGNTCLNTCYETCRPRLCYGSFDSCGQICP
jgi:hypothetical protein